MNKSHLVTEEQLNELIEKYGFFSVTRRKQRTPSLILNALLELKQVRAKARAKSTVTINEGEY
jgi:hypothetical protein